MTVNKHIKSIVLLMMLSCAVFSQDKRLVKADENFEYYAFVDARKKYLDVAENGYSSADLYKKLGDSYYFNAALENAAKWYEKLVAEYPSEIGVEYLFRYAQCLKSMQRYDEADNIMEKFSAVISNDQRAAFFTSTRDYLRFIAMQSGKFEIRKLAINSEYSDHAPSYDHRGRLVFASSRPGSSVSRSIHKWNEMPFLNLFASDETATGDSLATPAKLKGKINTRFHESSTAFSKDGTTVYFTRNNYTAGKLGVNSEGTTLLKLYRATLKGDTWENIEELPFNSDNYSTAHPALSPDGKRLYFASDMPGGKGMSDLYVAAIHEDGTFGTPENLGDRINTAGRETFPYIGDSGKLYFSSDGHAGLGGLDVFVALPEEGAGFSTPYNIGKPVNGPKDDFSFIIDEQAKTGYFASNRSGGTGQDDIYAFTQTGDLITRISEGYSLFEIPFITHTAFERQNQFPMQLSRRKEPDADTDLAELLGGSIDLS
ncbi:MAG: PD40 domain-containing protein, partial [Sinomicrobium sp.]|nr:PD40 domain-containing protein [Sinomicrobium sp.]